MSAPASLTGIAASASSAPRGGTVQLLPQITGGVSTIVGVDDQGNKVQVQIAQQVALTVASAAPTSGKAPAGTMVFWSDDAGDKLSVDGTNPLQLDLVKA